jgi:hypothetical protein
MKKIFFILFLFLFAGNTNGQIFTARGLIESGCSDLKCIGTFLEARGFYLREKEEDRYEYLSKKKYIQEYGGRKMEGANWVKVNRNGDNTVLWVKFSTLSFDVYKKLSDEVTSLGFRETGKKAYLSPSYPLVAVDKIWDNDYNGNAGFTGYNIIFYLPSKKPAQEPVKMNEPEKNEATEGLNYYYENGKYGFKDSRGKITIPAIYENVYPFEQGKFAKVKKEGKSGYINKTGKEIVPIKFAGTKYDSANSLFIVRLDEKFGFYDTTGKMTAEVKYDDINYLDNGYYEVTNYDLYGIAGKGGKLTVPVKYDEIYTSAESFISAARLDGKYGFIDITNGKTVIPFKYDFALWFNEGFAVVGIYTNSNWKQGYVDRNGKIIIPLKYNKAENFSEGLAAVALGSKYGFIDKTGKMVIPSKYDNAGNFTNGTAIVELNGRTFNIDKTGKEVK